MAFKELVFLSLLVTVFAKVHFNGDKVFRLHPATEDELSFVHKWIQELGDKVKGTSRDVDVKNQLDIWREPRVLGQGIDIHVRAQDVKDVKKMLTDAKIKFECLIEDLEKLIDDEVMSNNNNKAYSSSFDYDAYNRYGDIVSELQTLAKQYSNKAELFSAGRSYENREMVGIKVTDGSGIDKEVIWIDGGIHAREWVAPATVMFTLRELLQPQPRFASLIQQVLSKYDFYVLPVFNPDGYEFTHTTNRMWRKTRSPGGFGCKGADPNRNWDAHFGGAGTSGFPCADTYRGRTAFSEIEVEQVAKYLLDINKTKGLKSYWNLHAYSQLLLYPWSYTNQKTIDDAEIKRVGDEFARGVYETTGKKFIVGQPSTILYAVAGGSIDWTYEKLGVKYSYAPELRPTRNDGHGFLLPAYQIKRSGLEFTNGFLKAILAMK